MAEKLKALGFEEWFLDDGDRSVREGFRIARVVAVHRDAYVLSGGDRDAWAQLVGRAMYTAASPADYPTVGDWVLASAHDGEAFFVIHELLKRKSLIQRKTPGKAVDFQLVAANIDVAFVVQSLDANFNVNRLERYLVLVRDSGIRPVVLLSKSDLLDEKSVDDRVAEIHQGMPALEVHAFSNRTGSGLDAVTRLLEPRKTYALLGSSGVGKTTLLNRLVGGDRFKTEPVREKDGKGRHATTHRQLIVLDGGAMLIDTPGMRELGGIAVETGIRETFSDIVTLSRQCRFDDCSHEGEKGCAVRQAVTEGRLSEKRYRHYLKMTRESIHNEMSYADKREKDRQFGKMCRAVMRHKKNRR